MCRKAIIAIYLLLLIPVFCFARQAPEQQFQEHLQRWKQFHWLGIAEVNYKSFALRKYFTLAKNADAARLDLYDSGVFSLTLQPLAAVYLADSIALFAPSVKQLDDLDPNWFVPKGFARNLIQFTDSLQVRQQEILTTKKTTYNGLNFLFDRHYRIVSISYPASDITVKIEYTRKSEPDKITILISKQGKVILGVDQRHYTDIVIEPLLPPPGTQPMDKELIEPD